MVNWDCLRQSPTSMISCSISLRVYQYRLATLKGHLLRTSSDCSRGCGSSSAALWQTLSFDAKFAVEICRLFACLHRVLMPKTSCEWLIVSYKAILGLFPLGSECVGSAIFAVDMLLELYDFCVTADAILASSRCFGCYAFASTKNSLSRWSSQTKTRYAFLRLMSSFTMLRDQLFDRRADRRWRVCREEPWMIEWLDWGRGACFNLNQALPSVVKSTAKRKTCLGLETFPVRQSSVTESIDALA